MSEASALPPFYLAIAYRWGQENAHHYFVYCGPDKLRACQYANHERDYRGGKYGVAVYEFTQNGNECDYVIEFYAPSSMEAEDADGPKHNHRIDFFENLGHFIDGACRTGFIYVPVDGSSVMGSRAEQVEVPQYIRDEYARACETLATWERIEALKQESKDEQPPKDTPCQSKPETPNAPSVTSA